MFWKALRCLLGRILRLERWVAGDTGVTYISSDYTVSGSDGTIVIDSSGGPVGVTLPVAATMEGKRFTFKRVPNGGSDVTLTPQSLDLIDNSPDYVMINDYQAVSMRATATGFILTSSVGA